MLKINSVVQCDTALYISTSSTSVLIDHHAEAHHLALQE